ncbi:hypothetical protein KR222_008996 [Zaprionus bogoriensis]|nr:hypothetical protein KR222_008996 [Zaprionus bogoriensis]
MAELTDSKLDTQQQQEVAAAPPNSEINSVAAKEEEEEAEKAGTSTEPNKHEEKKTVSANIDDTKMDKLDELCSLEQEIAKMHNIQHSAESDHSETEATGQAKDTPGGKPENGRGSSDAQIMDELAQATRCTPDAVEHIKDAAESAATLEEVDLIALLKGTDQEQEQTPAAAAAAVDSAALVVEQNSSIELALAKLDNVGVTIEGEGQYEIMEIDDGDNASASSPVLPTANNQTAAKPVPKYAPAQGKPKLSPEQARAVALEQMADLKSHTARRKEAAAAAAATANTTLLRQQQQQQQKQPLDIISSLNDDWNEYDSESDAASNSNSNSNSIATAPPASKKPLPKKPKSVAESNQLLGINSVKVLVKSVTPSSLEKLKLAATTTERPNSNPEVTGNHALPCHATQSHPTGFKRTRVIKRKIIWDPDAPETQKSFAQYATARVTTTPTPTEKEATAAVAAATATTTTVADTVPKKTRPPTPKDAHKVVVKRTGTPAKLAEANSGQSPPKRRSQTPNVPNGGAGITAKKKKITEIDRLMGDEGAANMMQAVEREQRELSGGELPNKPLMRKRSLTLSGKQPQKAVEAAPVTPKKDTPPKTAKRATTSGAAASAAVDAVFAKATKQRPSDSWDYVYKQRASEESMIMRRRSNSSYSSNASLNRLSLDNKPAAVAGNLSDDASDAALPLNDPSFEFLKPENKANQRNDAATPPQTLANDLKRGALQQQGETKAGKPELVTVNKLEKVAQLVIHPQPSKTGYSYKLQLLQKLTEALNKLAKGNDCNTVLLCVQGQQFCQGIDCQELIAAAMDKRKANATQVALILKTYLRTLATFPKPLVAGIVGNLHNLGVMQLPLLDYVVAAEDCTYATSYAKLGQLPEGHALWHKHPKVSSRVHSRLFLLGERLQTPELVAEPNSFVDKSCKAHSVNEEALAVAKLISSSTAEHFRSIKKLNHAANTATLQRLEAEFKILTEQWPSASFQANYKRYVTELDI